MSLLLCGTLVLAYLSLVAPQSNQPQPGINIVIQDVLGAESAGAQPKEMAKLIDGLNSVLHLQDQLDNLGSQNTQSQQELQYEINSSLMRLDSDANRIAASASQRTFTEHVTAYVLGVVEAVIAAIATYCTIVVRRLAQRKRVFHLKIVLKQGGQS